MKRWVFLGDAHLNPYRKDSSWDAFRALMEEISPEGLVLMGDFFDFWFGFKENSILEGLYGEVGEVLRALGERGTRIIFLEGNHDFALQAEIFGVPVENYRWETSMEIEGKKVYLAHGDRAAGLPYSLPALFLKHPLTCRVVGGLGPKVVTRVAFWWCSRSRRGDRVPQVRSRLRSFAARKIAEGFDVVVMGHCHRAEAAEITVGSRTGLYFNVGSWMDGDYLLLQAGSFSLQKAPQARPEAVLSLPRAS